MKEIVILGAGGFAREVAWLISEINVDRVRYELIGFIDDVHPELKGACVNEWPVLGGFEWFDSRSSRRDLVVVTAVGSPAAKRILVEKAVARNLLFAPPLVHPGVRMSSSVQMGDGAIITAGNILTTNIRIGRHVNLNLDCTVGHDSQIADFCNISPGCHISGRVSLEEGVDVGTGACFIPKVTVGANAVIGAGAVVTHSIPAGVTAVGVPAKPLAGRTS